MTSKDVKATPENTSDAAAEMMTFVTKSKTTPSC